MEPRAQPLRFAIVGALTAVTYFALTLLFAGPVGIPIQLAILCAYPISLLVHFSGQRLFVFRSGDGFALALHHQAARYLAVGGTQTALALLITTFVPAWIGVDERVVYVFATILLAVAAFLLLRFHVFHRPKRALTAGRSG